jgi:hypothetical protein
MDAAGLLAVASSLLVIVTVLALLALLGRR